MNTLRARVKFIVSVGSLVGSNSLVLGQACTTVLVSVPLPGQDLITECDESAMTPDGRFVVFSSNSPSVVPNDTNNAFDVFVRDTLLGITERVSVTSTGMQAVGNSTNARISADGRYVAFGTDAALVASDTNGFRDVYVFDRVLATAKCVSVSSSGVPGNADSSVYRSSGYLDISADGQRVVFQSDASNLVAGDTNAKPDVFLHDMQTGLTTRQSVTSSGVQARGDRPCISGDGNWVAFESVSSNLGVPTGGQRQIFVRNINSGVTTRVSVSPTSTTLDACSIPAISYDGRFVAFQSSDPNLVPQDLNGLSDVFVRDMQFPYCELECVSQLGVQFTRGSEWANLSPDGRFVCFVGGGVDCVPGALYESSVLVRDRYLGTVRMVNRANTGKPGLSTDTTYVPCVSADGRRVSFSSRSSLILRDFGVGGGENIFLRDDPLPSPYSPFCIGDPVVCPCSSNPRTWSGCENSTYYSGTLVAIGHASVSDDTIQLVASGQAASSPTLFFQGTSQLGGGAGIVFGDGLRCVDGIVMRLAIKSATDLTASMGFANGTDPLVSAAGGLTAMGGIKYYQAWYRDSYAYCTPEQFNLTNGIAIDWQP